MLVDEILLELDPSGVLSVDNSEKAQNGPREDCQVRGRKFSEAFKLEAIGLTQPPGVRVPKILPFATCGFNVSQHMPSYGRVSVAT
jgi:hypothetical protein